MARPPLPRHDGTADFEKGPDMNPLSHLRRHRNPPAGALTPGRRPPALQQVLQQVLQPVPASSDPHLLACGWFESSYDLNAGLQVTEHRDVGAALQQVPASWSLDRQAACRPSC